VAIIILEWTRINKEYKFLFKIPLVMNISQDQNCSDNTIFWFSICNFQRVELVYSKNLTKNYGRIGSDKNNSLVKIMAELS
jgi:hypothetical protein